jgi:hypothetical protein
MGVSVVSTGLAKGKRLWCCLFEQDWHIWLPMWATLSLRALRVGSAPATSLLSDFSKSLHPSETGSFICETRMMIPCRIFVKIGRRTQHTVSGALWYYFNTLMASFNDPYLGSFTWRLKKYLIYNWPLVIGRLWCKFQGIQLFSGVL